RAKPGSSAAAASWTSGRTVQQDFLAARQRGPLAGEAAPLKNATGSIVAGNDEADKGWQLELRPCHSCQGGGDLARKSAAPEIALKRVENFELRHVVDEGAPDTGPSGEFAA